jgi:acetolactate synthase-1/2/3 large subunit
MNPGTSEMHFVAALDRVPAMLGILCLYEGVCSGAADGYGRVLGRPAATLLHLGPGLANGLSNFHNARKARTPIVNVVGEHATPHLRVDAPLTSDVRMFAGTVSGFVRVAESADDVGPAAAQTVAAAWGPPGQVATLIVPADFSWSQSSGPGTPLAPGKRTLPEEKTLSEAARLIREPHTAILLGGTSVNERALHAAARLNAATGVRFFTARNAGMNAVGRGRYPALQVPYFPEGALPLFADVKTLLLVESERPVSFFAYPDTPSEMTAPGCRDFILARRDQDGTAALEALAESLPPIAIPSPEPPAAPSDGDRLTPDVLGRALAAILPEDALVSDEMVSAAPTVLKHLRAAAPHHHLPVTGGSIGQGLPVAVGAAIAAPNRKVIALEADGSAMYSFQSLWTMVRENLDITIVIFANRRYQILDVEMQRTGANGFGPRAESMIDITNPTMDFVRIAEGLGVEAARAATAGEFSDLFKRSLRTRGPVLIEAVIA